MSDWINVKDKLPETYINVLCIVYGSDVIRLEPGENIEDAVKRLCSTPRRRIGFLDKDGCWNDCGGYQMIVSPTLWKPIDWGEY